MDQERLDEIRARTAGWNEGYSFNDRRIANGIILCVPDLLDEIERVRTELHKAKRHYAISGNLLRLTTAAVDELKVENEQLREAVKIAAQICRLQRKNWYGETGDDKAYEAWTKQIEYFEGLANANQK